MNKSKGKELLASDNIELSDKSSSLMKNKKRSKEELKYPSNLKLPTKSQLVKKTQQNGINRKNTVEKFQNPDTISQKSFESSSKVKQSKRKKLSEDTYQESKNSINNIIKKKRKSLMSKKWRREVKQQIENENLFKQSKEKKLDFSMGDSPITSNKISKIEGIKVDKVRKSVSQLRNEIIQDDSEDDQYRDESSYSSKIRRSQDSEARMVSASYESNPLQRIIEQRMMESSTDSEESEDELDDDYDIGIDDVDLGTEDNDDIHTATVSMNSMNSSLPMMARSIRDEMPTVKKHGVSPFTDIIENGLDSYLNNGSKKAENTSKVMVRNESKKKSKVYDYGHKEKDVKGERSSSQIIQRPKSKQGKKVNRRQVKDALGLSNSFDESPTSMLRNKKSDRRHEKELEEVRRDQNDLHIKSPL